MQKENTSNLLCI